MYLLNLLYFILFYSFYEGGGGGGERGLEPLDLMSKAPCLILFLFITIGIQSVFDVLVRISING